MAKALWKDGESQWVPPQTLFVVFRSKFCRVRIQRAGQSTKGCLEPSVGESVSARTIYVVILSQIPGGHTPLGISNNDTQKIVLDYFILF